MQNIVTAARPEQLSTQVMLVILVRIDQKTTTAIPDMIVARRNDGNNRQQQSPKYASQCRNSCSATKKNHDPLLWSRPWKKYILYFLGMGSYDRNPEPTKVWKYRYE